MFKNKVLLLSLLAVFCAVLYVTFFSETDTNTVSVDPQQYRQEVETSRAKKDAFFKTGADSPLTDKSKFTGLLYFPPDPAYRVLARLEPFADKTQKLVVRMTDGSEEVYEKFAHAVFSLNGEACRLLIVKLGGTYSILFRDATSGKETYGGGRYLELNPDQLTDSGALLDFNTAYNPYCAYNHTYACPLPPAENTLKIAVKAGERYVDK
ncbi:DUF1684 domain-containing protein [Spirosoma montaniterrae]|uniref:DUF1684 domain-containing protein n=1 Tax=Spirosoma montaniterrae TaxID=1178516 RepID=A0A1P9WY81_9BACT|nr:DUF1684 domain-containing protein [Spirosoma montaniterrae]AQG80346.1 hypothetical protein AWR27_14070 [Spirosoma montaniterrae]